MFAGVTSSITLVACLDLDYLSEGGELSDASGDSTLASGPPSIDSANGQEGGQDGSSPHSDGGSSDAGKENLLSNGDFELGCAGWSAYFGNISESGTARSGAGSCKFCMVGNWEAFAEQDIKMQVGANETYVAQIWVQGVQSSAELEDAGIRGGQTQIGTGPDHSTGSNSPIPETWERMTAILTTTKASDTLSFAFRLEKSGDAPVNNICVLLDDAILYRTQ